MIIGTGCVRITPISDASPVNHTIAAVNDRFDAAILSVNFEPSSTISDTAAPDDVALVVAVDNRGRGALRDLTVTARVAAPTEDQVIAEVRESITNLAPGEAKVIRFSQRIVAPTQPTYWITVQVSPVDGEENVANNRKSLRLDVTNP